MPTRAGRRRWGVSRVSFRSKLGVSHADNRCPLFSCVRSIVRRRCMLVLEPEKHDDRTVPCGQSLSSKWIVARARACRLRVRCTAHDLEISLLTACCDDAPNHEKNYSQQVLRAEKEVTLELRRLSNLDIYPVAELAHIRREHDSMAKEWRQVSPYTRRGRDMPRFLFPEPTFGTTFSTVRSTSPIKALRCCMGC